MNKHTYAPRVISTATKPSNTVATKKTTQVFRKTRTVINDPKVLADVAALQAILEAPAAKAKHGGKNGK